MSEGDVEAGKNCEAIFFAACRMTIRAIYARSCRNAVCKLQVPARSTRREERLCDALSFDCAPVPVNTSMPLRL